jgi:hypothetical protein
LTKFSASLPGALESKKAPEPRLLRAEEARLCSVQESVQESVQQSGQKT